MSDAVEPGTHCLQTKLLLVYAVSSLFTSLFTSKLTYVLFLASISCLCHNGDSAHFQYMKVGSMFLSISSSRVKFAQFVRKEALACAVARSTGFAGYSFILDMSFTSFLYAEWM